MNDSENPTETSPKAGVQAELRRRRQAEALRANLARRKAQDRARAADDDQPPKDGEKD
jgi:hypothetical protein